MSNARNDPRPTADSLDLHGLTVTEALERFVEQYNLRVKGGHLGGWTIVHGYGSSGKGGAIRSKLRAFLDRFPEKLRQEAGDNYGNPGWTWVYPKIRLPDRRERLALEILEYCSTPRGDEKIQREFVTEGGVLVKEVLRSLAKAGRLQVVHRGVKVQYQTAKL